jgi:hypothetical protein
MLRAAVGELTDAQEALPSERRTRPATSSTGRGGHTGWTDEGVTFLESSPTEDILLVLDHLSKQLAG